MVKADNRPDSLMVAVPVPLMTLQTTALSVALAGKTDAVICMVPWNVEIVIAPDGPDTVIELTGTSSAFVVVMPAQAVMDMMNPINMIVVKTFSSVKLFFINIQTQPPSGCCIALVNSQVSSSILPYFHIVNAICIYTLVFT
ncbi:MAG: hypothetical protein Q8N15_01050 [Bacillota bacterium]|nr:hypothetical protein [Bacillota bacterium]